MSAKKTYVDAMAEEVQRTTPPCVICEHPERLAIEQDHAAGKPYSQIGKVLKRIGTISEVVTAETASRIVAKHFDHAGKGGE